MSSLRILKYPHPFLKRVAAPVTQITDDTYKGVQALLDTMDKYGGIGVAANQIGWDARVFVARDLGNPKYCLIAINPEIVEVGPWKDSTEGCLSLPYISATVPRREWVRLTFQDEEGSFYDTKFSFDLARIICHEVDHLNGMCIDQKMTSSDKLANKRILEMLRLEAGILPKNAYIDYETKDTTIKVAKGVRGRRGRKK